MKKILSLVGILVLSLVIYGCATNNSLQSGGVYSGDAFLYNSDNTFASSYTVIDSFLVWEVNNNDWVKTNSPQTFQIANEIRQKTPVVIADYAKARSEYINFFNKTNASLLNFSTISNNLLSAVNEIQSESASTILISTNITK